MNRILRGSLPHGASPWRWVLLFCGLAATMVAAEDNAAILGRLSAFRKEPNPAALDYAWPHLDSADRSVREAARRAVQAQPFDQWKDRALEEKSTWASLELLRALAEACPRSSAAALSPHVCEQITTLRFEGMDAMQWLAAIDLTRVVVQRLGPLTEDELKQMLDLWSHLSPPAGVAAARERSELLEFLRGARPRSP